MELLELEADLVLEGGGVKGIALVGAIEVLEERGYRFRRVAGTSAGAIVGSLVAAGVPATRLVEIMGSLHYPDLLDGSWASGTVIGKAAAVLAHSGIYRGERLRTWLRARLDEHGVRTFADLPYVDPLQAPDPERAYRLVVTASDISRERLRYLPWEYGVYGRDPGAQEVADAVRASMSIPFLYRPVRWRGPDGEETWLVDGGLLSDFPISVFDTPPGMAPRWPTLGIKLSTRAEAVQGEHHRITGPVSMSVAMLRTMNEFFDRMHIDDPDAQARTIFVDTGHVRATDFDLSEADQEFLYRNGRAAAERFLDGTAHRPAWDFERYLAMYRG